MSDKHNKHTPSEKQPSFSTRAFLKALGGNYRLSANLFEDTDNPKWKDLVARNVRSLTTDKHAGIFFLVQEPRDPKGPRSEKNILRVRAVFADDDTPRATPRNDFDVPPTFIVRSSGQDGMGKYHYYWLLKDTGCVAFDRAKRLLKHIAVKYGTDPAVADLSRVMRLPGTLHWKSGKGVKVEVVHALTANGELVRYRLDDLCGRMGLGEGAEVIPLDAARGAPGPRDDLALPTLGEAQAGDLERLDGLLQVLVPWRLDGEPDGTGYERRTDVCRCVGRHFYGTEWEDAAWVRLEQWMAQHPGKDLSGEVAKNRREVIRGATGEGGFTDGGFGTIVRMARNALEGGQVGGLPDAQERQAAAQSALTQRVAKPQPPATIGATALDTQPYNRPSVGAQAEYDLLVEALNAIKPIKEQTVNNITTAVAREFRDSDLLSDAESVVRFWAGGLFVEEAWALGFNDDPKVPKLITFQSVIKYAYDAVRWLEGRAVDPGELTSSERKIVLTEAEVDASADAGTLRAALQRVHDLWSDGAPLPEAAAVASVAPAAPAPPVKSRFTDLPPPHGWLGILAKEIFESMDFPNRTIATLTALMFAAAVAGRKDSLDNDTGCSLWFTLIADSGTGKDTLVSAISRLLTEAADHINSNPKEGDDAQLLNSVSKYTITTQKYGVTDLVEYMARTPSMALITREAGLARQSKAGAPSDVKGALMSIVAEGPYRTRLVATGKNTALRSNPRGTNLLVVEESTPTEFKITENEFESGEGARRMLIFASVVPSTEKPNLTKRTQWGQKVIDGAVKLLREMVRSEYAGWEFTGDKMEDAEAAVARKNDFVRSLFEAPEKRVFTFTPDAKAFVNDLLVKEHNRRRGLNDDDYDPIVHKDESRRIQWVKVMALLFARTEQVVSGGPLEVPLWAVEQANDCYDRIRSVERERSKGLIKATTTSIADELATWLKQQVERWQQTGKVVASLSGKKQHTFVDTGNGPLIAFPRNAIVRAFGQGRRHVRLREALKNHNGAEVKSVTDLVRDMFAACEIEGTIVKVGKHNFGDGVEVPVYSILNTTTN